MAGAGNGAGNGSGGSGIGARVPRKEDARFLHGRGQFVGDIRLAGMQDVAFVRSPIAHGRLKGIDHPADAPVFTAGDLDGVKPIRAVSGLAGFKASDQPILATGKVRHVGEMIAACVAADRALAEDLADQVEPDIEALAPVVDMARARAGDAPLIHEDWGDNIFLESRFEAGDLARMDTAPVTIRRRFRMARQSMAPLEGRGVVAHWDRLARQLVVYSSAQLPHIVRTGLATCLDLPERRIRVIAPDVGGGFGYKGILLPEEVCVCWLAMQLDRPMRWLEDRHEALSAAANCREHAYDITIHADHDGRILGVDAEATVDAGAYSSYPFSACLEAAQVASILPGPYDLPAFRCVTYSAATNKCPILPYRGVARAPVCTVMEAMIDHLARAVGRAPHAVRLTNLVRPEQMPFDNITHKHFDSGDYPECLRRLVRMLDIEAVRRRQARGEADGRLIGVGLAIFNEQAAHGTSVYAAWGIPMVPGAEQAFVRFTPDGGLEARIGLQCHGQGLETSLAQVAHSLLGLPLDAIEISHGDTGLSPYSTGTWGSRAMVVAGGAVAEGCRLLGERAAAIGAHLLQVPADQVRLDGGRVVSATGSVSLADIAATWYKRPQDLPGDVDPGGLEVTAGYKADRDTGTFSYAAHGAVVAVDTETGMVEILDYAVVEDGGVLINPLIVDGQVIGGAAQGIGTALYEEMPFDDQGQPLATTLADYILPGATEVPAIRIDHMETPAPYTRFGQKGIGEGGAIGPPAALINAVNDALTALGAEMTALPMSPERILAAIMAAENTEETG